MHCAVPIGQFRATCSLGNISFGKKKKKQMFLCVCDVVMHDIFFRELKVSNNIQIYEENRIACCL